MRKMLNTLFITSEDAYLALENENVVVLRGEEKMGQYPLTIPYWPTDKRSTESGSGYPPRSLFSCLLKSVALTEKLLSLVNYR